MDLKNATKILATAGAIKDAAAAAGVLYDHPVVAQSSSITTEPVAKPFYLSTGVLALIAGMILAVATRFFGNELPTFMTKDNVVTFLIWFIPLAVGLYGRLTASKILTGSAASADQINRAVS